MPALGLPESDGNLAPLRPPAANFAPLSLASAVDWSRGAGAAGRAATFSTPGAP